MNKTVKTILALFAGTAAGLQTLIPVLGADIQSSTDPVLTEEMESQTETENLDETEIHPEEDTQPETEPELSDEEEAPADPVDSDSEENHYGFYNDIFYSYETGLPFQGLFILDGNIYYAKENGDLARNEPIWLDGVEYFFDTDGTLHRGPLWKNDSLSNYSWLNGSQLKGLFQQNGKLYLPGEIQKNTLVDYQGNTYYQKSDGSLARDELIWNGESWYYFGSTAAMARNELFEQDGKELYVNPEGLVFQIEKEQKTLLEYVQQTYQTKGTALRTLYDWIVEDMTYTNDVNTRDVSEYALIGFEKMKGNCLSYAAMFYYLAYYLGYSASFVNAYVQYSDGNIGDHGWVTIKEDGTDYIYDPQAQHEYGDKIDAFRIDPARPPLRYVEDLENNPWKTDASAQAE